MKSPFRSGKTCHVETWHFTWWHVQGEYVDTFGSLLLKYFIDSQFTRSHLYFQWLRPLIRVLSPEATEPNQVNWLGFTSLHRGTYFHAFPDNTVLLFLQCRQQWHLSIYHTTQDLPIALHRFSNAQHCITQNSSCATMKYSGYPERGLLPSVPTLHFARRQWCCQLPNRELPLCTRWSVEHIRTTRLQSPCSKNTPTQLGTSL